MSSEIVFFLFFDFLMRRITSLNLIVIKIQKGCFSFRIIILNFKASSSVLQSHENFLTLANTKFN